MTDQAKRPQMRHYGIAAEQQGLLSWDWVDQQMAQARNYWIGSTRPDGRPHAAPVWGLWIDGGFYFSSDPQSRKVRNFEQNPEIVVHLESGDDTVILEGRIDKATDPQLMVRLDTAYAAKYPPFDPAANGTHSAFYYTIRIRTALAWQEHDFTQSATRWDFDA